MTAWPALPLAEWRETRDTLHMWTQVVGKIRMALTPLINHWWNVPLYVSGRGLTTLAIPFEDRTFELEFDLCNHLLVLRMPGTNEQLPLAPRSVADFYAATMAMLRRHGIHPEIWTTPVEVPDPIPFEEDTKHASYNRAYVERFRDVLTLSNAALTQFRARFQGKCSPVHFFWGSFDLAVTRFSGRPAPPKPEADAITREAYSHEVSSVGWWPGDDRLPEPSYYSYASPEPSGFRDAKVSPPGTYYNEALGGFYLPYDAVRTSADPEATLLQFCQTTYDAAADLGHWDRKALER
jgi:hypothetical protein